MNAAFTDKTFLIVAGQPKAGTTSIFDWIAQHPDVCGSRTKETRFFLDADYPLPRSFGFDGTNLGDYAKLFEHPERRVMLEATPDYMFSPQFLKVVDLLPNARIVVLTRDPVDRVTSAFNFYSQRAKLPKGWSLDDYVSHMAATPVTADTPAPLRVLEQCRPHYLDQLRVCFGERLKVIEFQALRDRPAEVLAEICIFAGLPPITDITFDNRNKSRGVRYRSFARVFYSLRPRLVYLLQRLRLDRLIPLLRRAKNRFEAALSSDLEKTEVSAQTAAAIRAYLEPQT